MELFLNEVWNLDGFSSKVYVFTFICSVNSHKCFMSFITNIADIVAGHPYFFILYICSPMISLAIVPTAKMGLPSPLSSGQSCV